MGFFNNKNNDIKSIKQILVTTTENIPNKKYEIIGIVTTEIMKITKLDVKKVFISLSNEAIRLNADAVVSARVIALKNSINTISQSAYGTAVKYTD